MSETVTVKKFRYVLDWFEVTDVAVEVGKGHAFTMQYRLGSWYLMGRHYDAKAEKWISREDFQLDDPADAFIKLGTRIQGLDCLHGGGIAEPLKKLMERVQQRIARQ
jgi:hypothetical protein